MLNWPQTLLPDTGTLADAVRVIDKSRAKICLVVDGERRLQGTVTDGDMRRAILRGLSLSSPVTEAMKRTPTTGHVDDSPEQLREIMARLELSQIPVLDSQERVVGLVTAKSLVNAGLPRDNWVILMAGGLGSRLKPLTADTPKPLLKVGRKPLLETIIETFTRHEFRSFFISINYKAEMIKEHFGDGAKWECEIRYLEEDQRLGTAGALGLLPARPASPIVIMNGDVLTNVDFSSLLEFHAEQGSKATMCVREYDFQVPYGVVNIDGQRITSIVEKPVHNFFVNAGIYVVDPELISFIPQDAPFDMTDLFALALGKGMTTAAFPIREYWMDIGRMDDFHRANGDYDKFFV
jgi:dTDP-glucose pyrophosphorylase